jgi:hypothetical protein
MDMHSGGGRKLDFEYLWIEAPEDEAKRVFYNRFGRNPEKVTCTCCGDDYSISEYASLDEATKYERTHYRTKEIQPLQEYLAERKMTAVIYAKDIKPEEREGSVPRQGYVWVDD